MRVSRVFQILFFIAASTAFGAIPARAEDILPKKSLFFSAEETREAERLAQKSPAAKQGRIHLGAIMYYGPEDWTIWLQGERTTPQTKREDLDILDVTPDGVRLFWHGDERSPPKEITLAPNQSSRLSE